MVEVEIIQSSLINSVQATFNSYVALKVILRNGDGKCQKSGPLRVWKQGQVPVQYIQSIDTVCRYHTHRWRRLDLSSGQWGGTMEGWGGRWTRQSIVCMYVCMYIHTAPTIQEQYCTVDIGSIPSDSMYCTVSTR